jgi:hypothetical protein
MPDRSKEELRVWLLLVSSGMTTAGALLVLHSLLRSHSSGSPPSVIGIAVAVVSGALFIAILLQLRGLRRRKG